MLGHVQHAAADELTDAACCIKHMTWPLSEAFLDQHLTWLLLALQTHPGLVAVEVETALDAQMPQEQWSLQELERIEAEQVRQLCRIYL